MHVLTISIVSIVAKVLSWGGVIKSTKNSYSGGGVIDLKKLDDTIETHFADKDPAKAVEYVAAYYAAKRVKQMCKKANLDPKKVEVVIFSADKEFLKAMKAPPHVTMTDTRKVRKLLTDLLESFGGYSITPDTDGKLVEHPAIVAALAQKVHKPEIWTARNTNK